MYSTLYTKCKGCYTFVMKCKGTYTFEEWSFEKSNPRITQLADHLEVTRQTIISLENGRYNASLILAYKISRFFDLMIEEVFIFDEEDE